MKTVRHQRVRETWNTARGVSYKSSLLLMYLILECCLFCVHPQRQRCGFRADFGLAGFRASYQMRQARGLSITVIRGAGSLLQFTPHELADHSLQLPVHYSSPQALSRLAIPGPAVKIRIREGVDQWTDNWWMKDATRSANLEPISNDFAGNCGVFP